MAWSASKIMTATIANTLTQTALFDFDTHTFTVALFDNSITPSQTDTAAHQAYAGAGGQWASGGVSDASGWPASGRDLSSVTVSTATTNPFTWDAADTVSANSTTTLTNAYGCLVYDNSLTTPVADQGVCYNYFGGANSVVAGTFTVVWNVSGILALTL